MYLKNNVFYVCYRFQVDMVNGIPTYYDVANIFICSEPHYYNFQMYHIKRKETGLEFNSGGEGYCRFLDITEFSCVYLNTIPT